MAQMSEHKALELFDDWLNECYGDLDVAGIEYPTALVLKTVDYTAYRTMFNDWTDAQDIEVD